MQNLKKVFILGGNGFLGSSMIEYFYNKIGYIITTLDLKFDNMPKDRITYIEDSITNIGNYKVILEEQDVILHFIGKSGAIDSFDNFRIDVEINNLGMLSLLNAVRELKSKPLIIFPSSRLVYKRANEIKLTNETFDTYPDTVYGANKLACEMYLHCYNNLYGIDYIVLRISLPYGLTSRIYNKYGIINYFISKANSNSEINIYGDGMQVRDIIYIKDLTKIFELVIDNKNILRNDVYNVGGIEVVEIGEIARTIVEYFGKGKIKNIDWPSDIKKIETGDCFLDSSKLYNLINYRPQFSLKEAIIDIQKDLLQEDSK